MCIDTLKRKVMDTLTVEQLEEHLAKWNARLWDAIDKNDTEGTEACGKQVRLFQKRLERARAAEDPGAAS